MVYSDFLIALFILIVIKIPFLRYLLRKKVSKRLSTIVGIIATTSTLPYLWFVLPVYIRNPYTIEIGITFVILVEALIFYYLFRLTYLRCLTYSFYINISAYYAWILLVQHVFPAVF